MTCQMIYLANEATNTLIALPIENEYLGLPYRS